MFSSQKDKIDLISAIYQENRTLFSLKDIVILSGETNFIRQYNMNKIAIYLDYNRNLFYIFDLFPL